MNQTSPHFPDCFHRVTIKGVCVRNGKVLMIKGSDSKSGKWELPGGGLDFGEDIEVGLRREVREEMGVELTKVSEKPVYAWPHKAVGRRELDWFYVLVLCYRVEFESLEITPTDECEEVRFCTIDEVAKLPLSDQLESLPKNYKAEDFTLPI